MSIHMLVAAAYIKDLEPATKLILMAFADSADEHTRESAPGFPKLRAWGGRKRSQTTEIVRQLVDAGLLTNLEEGRLGRRAVYTVFPYGVPAIPHPSEVAARFHTPVENPVQEGPVDRPLGAGETPTRGRSTGPLHASTSVSRAEAAPKPVDSRPTSSAASGFPGARKAAAETTPDPRTQRGHHDLPCPVGDHGAKGEVAGGCGRCAHDAVNSDPAKVAQARAEARAATRAALRGTP